MGKRKPGYIGTFKIVGVWLVDLGLLLLWHRHFAHEEVGASL